MTTALDRVAEAIRYGRRAERIELEGLSPAQVRAALHALRDQERARRDARGVWRSVPAPAPGRASQVDVLRAIGKRGARIETIASRARCTIYQARSALYRLRRAGLVRHVEPGRWEREKRS